MTQDVGNRGLELGVGGMTCAACVRRVENGLRKLPRVSEAAVNLATERARVQFADPIQPGDKQLVSDLIRKLGYEPIELTVPGASAQPEHKRVEQNLWLNFLASSVFTIPLLILAMAPMISARVMDYMMAAMPMETWNWLMLCLAAPVQFWFGWQFLRLGIKSLLALTPDMNALVLIGTTAAFAYSTVVTVWPDSVPVESRHVYFEASAVVITLILLGKFLETRSRHQASDAMKSLLNLVPQSAVVVRSGRTEKIPVDQIRVGDVVEVAPGSAIAVDGIVENGQTYIDESMVTGEPIAVFKQAGDRVVAGTLNTNGTIQFRADAVGADTTLAKIVAFVASAQASKPRIQGLADRVVAYFVPVVLLIALVTALGWLFAVPDGRLDQALIHAVAVLIIACPCAMGLAVPTSIMVGTGQAARLGFLFRSSAAVQSLSEVNAIAFDKTGTITVGKPQMLELRTFGDCDADKLLGELALIERRSEHPLASAIVGAADARKLSSTATIGRFKAIAGAGVEATLDNGSAFLIGSEQFLRERSIDLSAASTAIQSAGKSGTSYFLAAVDGQLAGLVTIADPIKPDANVAMASLRRQGVGLAMISGDNARTAQAVAANVGIAAADVYAEVMPNAKAHVIESLQRDGQRVAFVGDGLNDAPALTVASVGIAMGTGTDLAIESADVIIMSGELQSVARAVALARDVMKNIRQNLLWAFGYNIILIPVASGLFTTWGLGLSPLMAGAAMSLSSFFVVSNALRLRRWNGPA